MGGTVYVTVCVYVLERWGMERLRRRDRYTEMEEIEEGQEGSRFYHDRGNSMTGSKLYDCF